MAAFGDVVLKFGATGREDEPPLRFRAGQINLIVGPNDAGKSLMLRELSGVNPRAGRRARSSSIHARPARIVAAVEWSEENARELQQELIAELLTGKGPTGSTIVPQSWESLVPALEQAATVLNELGDELCRALLALATSPLAEMVKQTVSLLAQGTGPQQVLKPLVIVGGVLMLAEHVMTREATPAAGQEPQPAAGSRALPDELATALRTSFEQTWARCLPLLRALGIDTNDLSLDRLFEPVNLQRFLQAKLLAELPPPLLILLEPLLSAMPAELPRDPGPGSAELIERFYDVGKWLVDPTPLKVTLDTLRESYRGSTWLDPDMRSRLAEDALYLDGLARLEITRPARLEPYGEDKASEAPILALLKDPETRKFLRALVNDALGAHLVIDMTTHAPEVSWRLAKEEPRDDLEASYSHEASRFLRDALPLEERSDGIHAFVGMLAAILAKDTDTVYIDEPEAFLHPPLVRKLARQLSIIAAQQDRQIFIATHSADLLSSFASVGAEVNVVRLTYGEGRATARLLDSVALRELSLDPLLRSEPTLSALFHEGAIICEAAADRVLYKEINERLLRHGEWHDDGVESCVFLNAQNWQTSARMLAPLRRMGVAAAAILDSDVLFGKELTEVLKAAQVPDVMRKGWNHLRYGLREEIAKRTGKDPRDVQLKGKEIERLSAGEDEIFKNLCSNMADYGIFIVPVGELENWLVPLGLEHVVDKPKWLRRALDRLGTDPDAEGYALPASGDIWDFMRTISAWMLAADRKGTSPDPEQSA